ncbi:hypothetical protein FOCC_FOCC010980 [Frankliniella occidentalis]|nr:hypothetical protein FOCC_FOCC010980 [Frankliniella occidentalis]
MHVFNLCKDFVPTSHRNALSPFQEFMVMMMRLRLHLLMEDLAYRFNISQPTVSRIITKWLEVMSLRLKSLIIWPEREILGKTITECFLRASGGHRILRRVGKLVEGIRQINTVRFACKVWDLVKLQAPQYSQVPHRHHSTRHKLGSSNLRTCIERAQLSSEEVDTTRQIAHVRVHVERVIGLVRRKFRILSQQMPLDSLKIKEGQACAPLDQIVVVCCALSNLCPPIIPMFEKEERHWQ